MPYPIGEDEGPDIPAMDWPKGHPVATLPGGYYDFIAYWNNGYCYECHETLEAVWLDTQGAERNFYQGLIHVATAFHHVTRANMKGARLLLLSGSELLEPYEDGFLHFPLDNWKTMCDKWYPLIDKAWRRKKLVELDAAPLPPIDLYPIE